MKAKDMLLTVLCATLSNLSVLQLNSVGAESDDPQVRQASSPEESAWARARGTNSVTAYHEFLRAYPNSAHRESARQAIDKLFAALDIDSLPKTREFNFNTPDGQMTLTLEVGSETKPRSVKTKSSHIGDGIFLAHGPGRIDGHVESVLFFPGYPFFVSDLSVESTRMLPKPITIRISEVIEDTVLPHPDSLVPVHMTFPKPGEERIIRTDLSFARAIGVTWEMEGKGIEITTRAHKLVAARKGARICFTKYGTTVEGFTIERVRPKDDQEEEEELPRTQH
jgi:hypothetical protein